MSLLTNSLKKVSLDGAGSPLTRVGQLSSGGLLPGSQTSPESGRTLHANNKM